MNGSLHTALESRCKSLLHEKVEFDSKKKKAVVYLQCMSSGNDNPLIKNIPNCSEHAPKLSGHQHHASSHCHIAVCNFGAHVLLSAISGLSSALYMQCKKHSVFSEFALNQILSSLLL